MSFWWQASHWPVFGISYDGPPATATFSPVSLRTASVSSAFQRYVVCRHRPSSFVKRRVSIRLPPTLNSFQTFTPSGNFHLSKLVTSIVAFGGRYNHRCFSAPSLQNCRAGVYARFWAATVFEPKSS